MKGVAFTIILLKILISVLLLAVSTSSIQAQGLFGTIDEKKAEEKKVIITPTEQKQVPQSQKKTQTSTHLRKDSSLIIYKEDARLYYKSIGIRAGLISGLSFKCFIDSSSSIEIIAGTSYHKFSVGGLYEFHKANVFHKPNIAWICGVGAYWKNGNYFKSRDNDAVGLVGMLGLEYRIKEIPFTVGFDLMPSFEFIGSGEAFLNGSIALRYCIR